MVDRYNNSIGGRLLLFNAHAGVALSVFMVVPCSSIVAEMLICFQNINAVPEPFKTFADFTAVDRVNDGDVQGRHYRSGWRGKD